MTKETGNEDAIIITRKGSVQAVAGSGDTFTGDVGIELVIPKRGDSRLSGGLVTFQAGARTHWHTHPYGQVLLVVAGRGRVGEQGRPAREIAAGDVVWFPAGVRHWHGAGPDGPMSHYALQEERDGGVVEWMEPVDDAMYNSGS